MHKNWDEWRWVWLGTVGFWILANISGVFQIFRWAFCRLCNGAGLHFQQVLWWFAHSWDLKIINSVALKDFFSLRIFICLFIEILYLIFKKLFKKKKISMFVCIKHQTRISGCWVWGPDLEATEWHGKCLQTTTTQALLQSLGLHFCR